MRGGRRARNLLKEGETLVLDGRLGVVYAEPDEAILEHYHQVQRDTARCRESLEQVRDRRCISMDGEVISLQANAGIQTPGRIHGIRPVDVQIPKTA